MTMQKDEINSNATMTNQAVFDEIIMESVFTFLTPEASLQYFTGDSEKDFDSVFTAEILKNLGAFCNANNLDPIEFLNGVEDNRYYDFGFLKCHIEKVSLINAINDKQSYFSIDLDKTRASDNIQNLQNEVDNDIKNKLPEFQWVKYARRFNNVNDIRHALMHRKVKVQFRAYKKLGSTIEEIENEINKNEEQAMPTDNKIEQQTATSKQTPAWQYLIVGVGFLSIAYLGYKYLAK